MFGGKATTDRGKVSLQTGGEIDGIVSALVNAANDPEEQVRSTIASSLYDIGFRQPGLVLSSCNDFLQKNVKADLRHRVILLKLINQVLEEKRDEIPEEFGVKLIEMSIAEMTREKDVVPDWQQSASSVLVSLGMRWPNQIMDELLKRFEPGTLPHYFVMKTMGDFVSANAVAAVPRLREVFSRVLPVLASIKHDNMRWVFAAAMGHFCEAVVHYVANIDQGIDKSVTITTYSGDVYPAYEFMYSKWMTSGEAKVRLATIQAVGSIFAILARDQFESQVAKIIPGIIALYRKEKDHLPVTHALASVLDCGVRGGGFKGALEPLLPPILITIHPFVCAPPDFSNSSALKNHNELLRCFEIIGRGFSDQLVTFLLGRIEQKEARTRIGALNVVKHIVTRLGKELEDKKGLLVSGVKPLVSNETVLSVKKSLAQVVIAMASHGYLLLEGGESLIEFIIRGSSLPCEEDDIKSPNGKKSAKGPVDIDGVTEIEIRNMCDNILNLITTTIPAMEPALWPYLFEAIVPPEFVGSLAVVCKCITYIASNKRTNEADDYIIDFDRAVNLPKPSAIIARLFVLLNAPFRRGQVGVRILDLLRSVGPILHPSLPALWDVTLPKMSQYLEDNSDADKWNKEQWEELVLRLLSESIKITNDDEWNVALGTAIADQIPFYNKDPELKKSSFKLLGMIMQKSGHKEFIRTKLDVMFASVDHTNAFESEGAAVGFGFCAATHLDIVLEKLQVVSKQHMVKKGGGGLFKFGGSSKDKAAMLGGGKKVKNTILLALGYVTSYAQPTLVASRIDVHIITPIKPFLPTLKSPLKKLCSIRMMNLVGKAVHPSHLQLDNPFVFKQRDDLVKIIQGYLAPPNPAQTNTQVKVQGLSTCATLLLLEPFAPVELESAIVSTALNFFNLPVDGENDSGLRALWDALNDMLSAILFNQTNIATLCRLIQHLETWMRSKETHHRERAASCFLHIVKKFIEYTKAKEKVDKEFTGVGPTVGLLIPRCTDPQETIRKTAMETIQLVLYIDCMLKSSEKTPPPPEALRLISALRERISSKEINEQFAVVHEMSRVLSALVSAEELPPLLQTTMIGLTDAQQTSTNGTCVVLNGLVKQRGEELAPHVATVVPGLLGAMEGISSEATMNGSLHALRNLALHHLLLVIDHLLGTPMPHSTHVVKSFQVVAKDRNLILPLVNHLTDIINNKLPYDEKHDKNKKIRTPELLTMAATCAFGEIMQTEELEETISAHYPQFLSTLLLRFGTANQNLSRTVESTPAASPPGTKAPAKVKPITTTIVPSQQIVQTFKNFLECGKDEQVQKTIDDAMWQKLEKDDYHLAISEIAEAICKAHSEQMRGVFEFMLPYLRGNYTPQRVVTASVFAAFVNHCKDDRELLQKLVNSLLSSIVDPNVKLVTLKGLSNVVANGPEQTNRYAPTIIDALVSSIDDQDEVIAMESMLGLSKVFGVVDESRVAPILVNICHRIRPAFEKKTDDIRAASFTLFGSLWRFGQDSAADAFYEQIHANLPSLVLHVNDDSIAVQNACKKSLRQLSPLFRSDEVTAFFAKKQFDIERSLNYDDFLNELSKILITCYLDRINYYAMTSIEFFKSQWNSIKGNAATFTGFLLGNLPVEKRPKINLNPSIVSRALIELLKEKAHPVRKKAAESLSLLYTY